jgi:hypothetical protein
MIQTIIAFAANRHQSAPSAVTATFTVGTPIRMDAITKFTDKNGLRKINWDIPQPASGFRSGFHAAANLQLVETSS